MNHRNHQPFSGRTRPVNKFPALLCDSSELNGDDRAINTANQRIPDLFSFFLDRIPAPLYRCFHKHFCAKKADVGYAVKESKGVKRNNQSSGSFFSKTASDHDRGGRKDLGKGPRLYLRKWFLILLLFVFLPVSSSVAENVKCSRMPLLMKSFLANHYAIKDLNAEINNQVVDQMIKRLDPSKTLLYDSDVQNLRPVLRRAFSSMQSGDCALLKPVYDLLVTRARENEKIIRRILGSNYRIDEDAELYIDVKKRPYVKTAAEKYDLLKKVVQFQIENDLLSGVTLAEAKKQQVHRYELQTARVLERRPEKLIEYAAEAFAQALDPHTNYLSPDNLEDLKIHMQLSLEGIGALLSSDNGFTVIEELIPGGSAEKSGLLKPKDKIIAVAQKRAKPVNVIDMDLRDVVKMIRGKKGTQVTLMILRQSERTYRFDITLTRDKVYIKDQEAKVDYQTRMVNGKKYSFAVIDLPSFYGDEKENKSSYEDVRALLMEARQRGVDGVVLDLSRNGGGLIGEAVQIAGLFLGRGPVVATKDNSEKLTVFVNGAATSEMKLRKNKIITFPAEDRPLYTGPLVVLTSRLSASASEIVAGALQDYRRAIIVGSDRTFGKGSVQTLAPLPRDLGGMKVTTGLYFLPGGKSTQKTGVPVDVRLPGFFVLEDVGEAELEYPLPAQAIQPFIKASSNSALLWTTVDHPMVAKLSIKSQARIAKDPKFKEIIQKNKEAAEKKGLIRLVDLREERKKEGGSNKKETPAELKQKVRDQYAPYVNESINILSDMMTAKAALPMAKAL